MDSSIKKFTDKLASYHNSTKFVERVLEILESAELITEKESKEIWRKHRDDQEEHV